MEHKKDFAAKYADISTQSMPMLLQAWSKLAAKDRRISLSAERDQYLVHHLVDARAEGYSQEESYARRVEKVEALALSDRL